MATVGGVPDPPNSPVESSIDVVAEDAEREDEVAQPYESLDRSVDVGIQYEPNIYPPQREALW
eukprot:2956756-Karenia_brevis.AAC.1